MTFYFGQLFSVYDVARLPPLVPVLVTKQQKAGELPKDTFFFLPPPFLLHNISQLSPLDPVLVTKQQEAGEWPQDTDI